MHITRRAFLASGLAAIAAAGAPKKPASMGVLLYSYGIRNRGEKGFAAPARFLEFCKERGAAGVQVPLGRTTAAEAVALRRACAKFGMYVEGIVRPPGKGKAELGRFADELAMTKACGATVARTVMLGGRRYEVFEKAEDYAAFARGAQESLERAEPVARKHGVKLAVENHKDFRVDEQVALLKKLSSEYVGACLDTGNNLALLEAPLATVEALAPFALTVHLKDMAVEEAPDGFRLAEVPLGEGFLDLKAVVAAIRKGNPRARFNLEMITRDPLAVRCLTDKYWATLGRVPGRELARMLALVRRVARKKPLPVVSTLAPEGRLAVEDSNVKASFAYAVKAGLVPAPGR